jgi:hypothetical protein
MENIKINFTTRMLSEMLDSIDNVNSSVLRKVKKNQIDLTQEFTFFSGSKVLNDRYNKNTSIYEKYKESKF